MRTLPRCALKLFTARAAFRDSRCFVQNAALYKILLCTKYRKKTTADRSASWLFFSFAEPSAGHDVRGKAVSMADNSLQRTAKQPAAPSFVHPNSVALCTFWLTLNTSSWSNVH
jgi:hypothetical protein